jgi:predicted choloylglycine hydrolase
MSIRSLIRIAGAVFAVIVLFQSSLSAEPRIEKVGGLRVVYLEGDPYKIGYDLGSLMKDDIVQVYNVYLGDLVYNDWVKKYAILKGASAAYGNPRKAMGQFAQGLVPHIPEVYIQEMKGLAEGAGLDYREVLNMTAHVDYFAVLMCSTLAATGDATTDGKLIEARNLDWAGGSAKELDPLTTVFVYKPDRGHSFVSVLYPGIVGALTVVNDAQITVELNFSMAKKNATEGFPALLISRHVAQNASSLDEAEALLRQIPRVAGYNIFVTDGKTNEARLIEITSDAIGSMGMDEKGLLGSTNHFITKELAGANVDSSRFSELPSDGRLNRLFEMMNDNYGKIDPAKAFEMIHDDGIKVSGTVQTVVFKPADHLMWVWARGREPSDVVEFNIKNMLGY